MSPQGSGGGGGQPNVDRYGQGGREVQKFPNLCRHPLCMTPTTTQKKNACSTAETKQKYIILRFD